jgi:ankyrin repeat protein
MIPLASLASSFLRTAAKARILPQGQKHELFFIYFVRVDFMHVRGEIAPVVAALVIASLTSCKLAAVDTGTTGPTALISLPEHVDQVVIPLSRAGNWRCIRVRIDGKDAGWFVVDTGASCTAIDKGLVKELGLRHVRDSETNVPSGSANTELVSYSELDVGPVSLRQGLAMAFDSPSISRKEKFKVSGVLGNDLLREQPFAIDFPASTLTLFRTQSFVPPRDVEAQPLTVRYGCPTVHGRVEGNDGSFLLDTGDAGGLTIHNRFLWEHHWAEPSNHFAKASVTDFARTVDAYSVVLGPLELIGKKVERQHVTLVSTDTGMYVTGEIGAAEMSEGRLTFDYANARMWVEWRGPESTDQMLKRLGNPKGKDLIGRTPLMIAAAVGRVDVIDSLSAQGVDVNAADATGLTALMYAAMKSRSDAVKALLFAGADSKLTWDRVTALHLSADRGDLGSVKAILAAGADRDAVDRSGLTPLMYAIMANYPDVAETLLDAGARVNGADKNGTTPLVYAAGYADLPMVKSLLARGAQINPPGTTPLISAAATGKISLVKFLLHAGAKIDAADANGKTALMLAAENRHDSVVQLLVGEGADFARKSHEGKTAVDYASDPYTLRTLLLASGKLGVGK